MYWSSSAPRAWQLSAILVVSSLFSACAAPDPTPLSSRAVVEAVRLRSEVDPAILRAALDAYDLTPLGLDRESLLAGLDDPSTDAYWHGRALTWGAGVRTALRMWRASELRARGAGTPDAVRLRYGIDDFDESSMQNEVSATVDVIRLLGLGPASPERDAAKTRAALALGRLEETLWSAAFAVDRARVTVEAARQREQAFIDLLTEAREGQRRIEMLGARGRIPAAVVGRAKAVIATLERRRSDIAATVSRAEEMLARATGLPPDAPAIGLRAAPTLRITKSRADSVRPDELLDRVPALRTARHAYALAEARVRVEYSSWWPALRVGPRLKIRPDNFLTGGVLSLDLPWPAAVRAEVDAALERRTAARERVEDALAATMAAAERFRQEMLVARQIERRDVESIRSGSARAWRGARARLSVEETQGALELWFDALGLRATGAVAAIDARERTWLATLRYREATGRAPGLGGVR